MNLVMILMTGILTFTGVYLVLSKNLIRIVLGTSILSHASNIFLLSMSQAGKNVPIIGNGEEYVDAVPQALILTAIVISFAITAFLLVIVYRTYRHTNHNHIDALGGHDE
ncbi:Na(+)/H(+) antiporter subunit C [Macrococcus brunensis]|uniref:Na(+)/H(+) antiporter subunit C n=1 Tax=Macrococcus brunensis TaxID=198483 RepID=A0A4R6BD98_9STAP|nr:Na(+)/H(+) antiporter subunit C [Macrococcus brunensis]TDL97724.1 Na(+)/H(+) antiporter subunit C [Macrococcus brunensis]ULG72876.1 Na(+)/H(+) antiporter subunit C [Macrococcus brunensis]ULG75124.1 Na(+)/H(+) antiporter subunit C [Macrococcus brunensis]